MVGSAESEKAPPEEEAGTIHGMDVSTAHVGPMTITLEPNTTIIEEVVGSRRGVVMRRGAGRDIITDTDLTAYSQPLMARRY